MNPLKVVFQVFFQPKRLEMYLSQNPRARKRLAWAHLAVALAWYVLCFLFCFIFYESLGWSFALVPTLVIYAFVILVAFFCGGIFKRDSVLSTMVGIYWSIIINLWWLVGYGLSMTGFLGYDNQDIIASSMIFLIIISIFAMVANLYEKTKGIKYASAFALAASIIGAIIMLRGAYSEDYPYPIFRQLDLIRKGGQEGAKYHLESSADMPRIDPDGLFIFVSRNRGTPYLSLNLKPGDGPSAETLEAMEFHAKRLEFLAYSSKGLFSYDPLLLENGWTFLQSGKGLQMVDPSDGRIIWSRTEEDWYEETSPDFYFDPVLLEGMIYGISPSGYFFAIRADDDEGNIVLRGSIESVYNDIRRNLIARHFAIVVGFYTGLGILVFCFGLYRVPFYAFESSLQMLSLIRVSAKRRNLAKAVRAAPLFLDHVSTLPLPFGKAFLRRIARKDPALCADRLAYLLGTTQQHRLGAKAFDEFHKQNPDLLFEYLYKSLQADNPELITTLAKRLDEDDPMGQLMRSYDRLLTAELKQPHLEGHAAILRRFAENNYRYARELYLTYNVFHSFSGFRSLQQLAESDQLLSDVLKISYGDLLNVQVIETFNVMVELASDLKNYDIVDNFRDKQYFLSEARIKLYEISRKAQEELHNPEQGIILEIAERWQDLITTEAKTTRGPAELELSMLSKSLSDVREWNPILLNVKNVGQSPAENVRVSLLENENIEVLDSQKVIRLLGTGEDRQMEFSVRPRGNPTEIRMYFDTVFDDFERKGKLRPFADVVNLSVNVEEFRKAPNTYIVGTPLMTRKLFFGREKALNFAIDNLKGGIQNNVLIFFGQRRIGKSSILYQLRETELKGEYLFVYIDCQGFADADTPRLLYRICNDIRKSAGRENINIERPALSKFKENTFLELDDYLDKVEEALGEKRVALMFDEYEFLEYKVKDGSVSPEIFNKLRNLMQHRNEKLAFIFVGTHRLTELTEDYWSFLFNIALYHEIGPLREDEARSLITQPVSGYLRYDDLAVDKILRVTGMHPYFIQVTCRLMVNFCNSQQKAYITLGDVNDIMKEAVEGSTAHVKYLYKDYTTDPEQEVLAFLSRLTDESKLFASVAEITRFADENQFKYDRRQVQEILSGLKNKKLIREDGEYRGELFGFEFEFLRLWIEDHVKIQQGYLTLI